MEQSRLIRIAFAAALALWASRPDASHASQYAKQSSELLSSSASREGRATTTALTVLSSASPGTFSAYAQGAGNFPTGSTLTGCSFPLTPAVSVQIKKGKRKSVVNVTAFASFGFTASSGSKGALYAYSRINGIVTPLPFAATVDCLSVFGEAGTCAVTDSEWYDLDDLEAQFPGSFKGQTLDIDLLVCVAIDDPSIVSIGEASMSAVMQRK
jgi:hypothetical protein